jgi:hypothetical protein
MENLRKCKKKLGGVKNLIKDLMLAPSRFGTKIKIKNCTKCTKRGTKNLNRNL